MIIKKIIEFLITKYGKSINKEENKNADKFKKDYEKSDDINYTAIISETLTNKILTGSIISVITENEKETFLKTAIDFYISNKLFKTVSQAIGKGGIVAVPYVNGNVIDVALIDQNRIIIAEKTQNELKRVFIVFDEFVDGNDSYTLVSEYLTENNKQIVNNFILNKDGARVPITTVKKWENVTETFVITNVKKHLFCWLKNSKDSRKITDNYGVPVTYGSEMIITDINKTYKMISDEYRLKKSKLILDEDMIQRNSNNELVYPTDDTDGYVILNSSNIEGDKKPVIFSPEVRHSAYFALLEHQYRLLEKSVGLSAGIFTEIKSIGATATEIKANLFSEYAYVNNMRKNIEEFIRELAESIYTLGSAIGLTTGNIGYTISTDWDFMQYQNSQETFAEMTYLEARGGLSLAELRSYVLEEPIEDAKVAIKEIEENETPSMYRKTVGEYGEQ